MTRHSMTSRRNFMRSRRRPLAARFLLTCLLCLLPAMLRAQQQERGSADEARADAQKATHQVSYFGEGERPDSLDERQLIDLFYYDQFRHFNDPRSPYFLFMSRDTRLAMGIGGVVRMRAWQEWGGVVEPSGFIPYLIQVPADPVRRRRTGSTPAGTALYFRVLGRNVSVGDYQLYIEANFNGYHSRDFMLQKAYAIVNDWTIGYTSSSFSDPIASPPLVDGQGPNAEVRTTAILLRWMHKLSHGWEVAASVEMPQSQVGANDSTTLALDDWMPNVAAFVQYGWGYNEHVRLSGIVRVLPYRDLTTGRNRSQTGWAVQASSLVRPARPLTLYATVNAGQGYGSLANDLLVDRLDLVDDPACPGRMYAPWSFGWFGAAQCYLRPDVFVTGTFGQMRYLPRGEVAGSTYKYGLYAAANLFWNLTPRIQVAGEFNWGLRRNFDGRQNSARRVSVVAQFAF